MKSSIRSKVITYYRKIQSSEELKTFRATNKARVLKVWRGKSLPTFPLNVLYISK